MESKNLNLEVMDKFIRFINTGDLDLGKSIISQDVVFYAPTSRNQCMVFRAIPPFST